MKTIEKIENETVCNCDGKICLVVDQTCSGEDLKAWKKRNAFRIAEIKRTIKNQK